MFFVWAIDYPDFDQDPVDANCWQPAMDDIHALPDGGLVIANTRDGVWVDDGHFDGLYNYATLRIEEEGGFSWAPGIPPGAWYVPSVLPGFSAQRINYPADSLVPRLDGQTYSDQWEAALGVGVDPEMVTITSFNEWHEGSQIEPAETGATNGQGYVYADYGTLGPEGYLVLTREWVERYLNAAWPAAYRVRLKITTTSDWTNLRLVSGGSWQRPVLVSASEQATDAWLEGDHFLLAQPLERAQAAGAAEVIVDILFTDLDPDGLLEFAIERGHLGATQVEVFNHLGDEPLSVENFSWGGINRGPENALIVQMPAADLLNPSP